MKIKITKPIPAPEAYKSFVKVNSIHNVDSVLGVEAEAINPRDAYGIRLPNGELLFVYVDECEEVSA